MSPVLNSEIEVVEKNGQRFYPIPRKGLWPSVTTFLNVIDKPRVREWRENLGDEAAQAALDEAADIGNVLHDCATAIAKGEPFDVKTDLFPMVEAVQSWFENTVDIVIGTNMIVYSDLYRYAGETDLVAILKGDIFPAIVDFKTSKAIFSEMGLQTASYQGAYNEGKDIGDQARRRLIVRVDKTDKGKIQTKHFTDDAKAYRAAICARQLYEYLAA